MFRGRLESRASRLESKVGETSVLLMNEQPPIRAGKSSEPPRTGSRYSSLRVASWRATRTVSRFPLPSFVLFDLSSGDATYVLMRSVCSDTMSKSSVTVVELRIAHQRTCAVPPVPVSRASAAEVKG